jgi:hypothetical protein
LSWPSWRWSGDPNYGSALAVATRCHSNIYACGWTNELKATRKVGIELARRALRVAADDPFVIANAAISLALFGEDIATTIALVDHSLRLNRTLERSASIVGWSVRPCD